VRISEIDPQLASRPSLDTGVSVRAHALFDRHVEDLSPGELAFCLRQAIAVPPVADRAIELLAGQPLLEVEHYNGDLLSAAIHAESNGWLSASQGDELRDICTSVVVRVAALTQDVIPLAKELIRRRDAT
jgi:hypothetical protein